MDLVSVVRAEVWLGASTSSTDMVEAYLVLCVFVSVVRVNNHTVHPQINGFSAKIFHRGPYKQIRNKERHDKNRK